MTDTSTAILRRPDREDRHGRLVMAFEPDSRGRTILRHLYRKVPIVVQQALYFDEQLPLMPCVYILSSGGPYVGGDTYDHSVTMAPDSMAHISTGAATKVAASGNEECWLHQRLRLEAGSYLEWLPQPTIPHRGARLRSFTEIDLHPSATLFYAESYTCGRLHHGEMFDFDLLDTRTTIRHTPASLHPNEWESGGEFMRESMLVEPHRYSPRQAACMGRYLHYGSVVMLAPSTISRTLYDTLQPRLTPSVAMSTAILRHDAGVAVRLLTTTTEQLKFHLRELCSAFRLQAKGRELPAEFVWR